MKHARNWMCIALALLAVNWALGVFATKDILPLWTFVVVNFPFGTLHAWFESHWTGTRYSFAGTPVSETWGFVTFFAMVVLQASAYYAAASLYRARSHPRPPAAQSTAPAS